MARGRERSHTLTLARLPGNEAGAEYFLSIVVKAFPRAEALQLGVGGVQVPALVPYSG